jgi:hypothetical protein
MPGTGVRVHRHRRLVSGQPNTRRSEVHAACGVIASRLVQFPFWHTICSASTSTQLNKARLAQAPSLPLDPDSRRPKREKTAPRETHLNKRLLLFRSPQCCMPFPQSITQPDIHRPTRAHFPSLRNVARPLDLHCRTLSVPYQRNKDDTEENRKKSIVPCQTLHTKLTHIT